MLHAARRIGATLGVVVAMTPALASAATPVDNGCPAAADLTAVATFDPSVYMLPSRLDDRANGGNGDGWICAFPLPDAVRVAGGYPATIYQFSENNLPAQGRR